MLKKEFWYVINKIEIIKKKNWNEHNSPIFNGENANSEYYSTLSTTICFAQLVLAFGSIIMIILNIKK
ncbi:MAG: hypothetical protein ACI4UU_03680 [Clostridia bacterium]